MTCIQQVYSNDPIISDWVLSVPIEYKSDIEKVICCPRLCSLAYEVKSFINTDLIINVEGETGVGKGVFAKFIHALSRPLLPYVAINCAAIPVERVEAELFGWERGSFPGASNSATGRIRNAQCGTLFIDEIGKAPNSMQAKFFQVVDRGEVWPVGAQSPVNIGCRLIFGANENLEELVKSKEFLEDLFFRIDVVKVTIPPLRERSQDIIILANKILSQISHQNDKSPPQISVEAKRILYSFDWPGNVRQLSHIMKKAFYRCSNNVITKNNIENCLNRNASTPSKLPEMVADYEKNMIEAAILATNNNTAAATQLGISHSTLKDKIRKYKLKSNYIRKSAKFSTFDRYKKVESQPIV